MAGIGFEIRKILKEKTIFSIIKAFSYAGAISSGPWIISMSSILVSAYLVEHFSHSKQQVVQFTLMITYLIAISLIYTGLSQLSFTRYISDILFKKEDEKVLPNTLGIVSINMIGGIFVILPLSVSIYIDTKDIFLTIVFESTFVILCALWIVNIVLTGLKNYKYITFSFLISYSIILILGFLFGKKGIDFFMLAYFIGQAILLFLLMFLMFKEFRSNELISFEFVSKLYKDLIIIGFFFNAAIWIDKFIFWFNPHTSIKGVGLLRYSPIYDYPVFLAYLLIAPGMAIFLLRIEADFAFYYDKYFSSAREGGSLKELYLYANDMIDSAKIGLIEILRIQLVVGILVIFFIKDIFSFFKISTIYIPLFIVDLIGVTLELFFMSIITILFYLDKRKKIMFLVIFVFLLNFILTLYSQYLGPFYYGYGTAIAYLLGSVVGLILLNNSFRRLHYETFMLI